LSSAQLMPRENTHSKHFNFDELSLSHLLLRLIQKKPIKHLKQVQ
jgi:hypothetical protein